MCKSCNVGAILDFPVFFVFWGIFGIFLYLFGIFAFFGISVLSFSTSLCLSCIFPCLPALVYIFVGCCGQWGHPLSFSCSLGYREVFRGSRRLQLFRSIALFPCEVLGNRALRQRGIGFALCFWGSLASSSSYASEILSVRPSTPAQDAT